MNEHAGDAATLAAAVGLPAAHADGVYGRVKEKLTREPVEGLPPGLRGRLRQPSRRRRRRPRTIGLRPRSRPARQNGTLPRLSGSASRTSATSCASARSGPRTSSSTRCCGRPAGTLPSNFVVTLPKITAASQVHALAEAFDRLEASHRLAPGSLRMELMVETPYSIFDDAGAVALPRLVARGAGA
jgi:hypothetical protein